MPLVFPHALKKDMAYSFKVRFNTSYKFLAGGRLTEFVIGEHDTLDFSECTFFCLENSSWCKSINYQRRKNKSFARNCQLNNASKTSHPMSLLADKNYDHYEQLEVVFLYHHFLL